MHTALLCTTLLGTATAPCCPPAAQPLLPFLAPGSRPGSVASGCSQQEVEEALAKAPRVVRGARYYCPSQAHFYMEPQTAVAVSCLCLAAFIALARGISAGSDTQVHM